MTRQQDFRFLKPQLLDGFVFNSITGNIICRCSTTRLLARLSCLSRCLSSSLSESDSLSVPELSSEDDDEEELLEHDELESDATPVSSFMSTESATLAISGRCFWKNIFKIRMKIGIDWI